MLTIQPMSLLDVRRDFGWIRNGLLEVIGRCKERFAPEDIWQQVMANVMHVWRIESSHDDIGFLVLRRDVDPDGPVLFIVALWAEPGSLGKHKVELFERLKELSHRMGAVRMRHESSRDEWLAVDYFTPVKRVFECEV